MYDHPLRLAVGSHKAGSGRGCAMNVISWENGDVEITDYPACSHRVLSSIVQHANDLACRCPGSTLTISPTGVGAPVLSRPLCAKCSVAVMDLAHRTVGSGSVVMSYEEACMVSATFNTLSSIGPVAAAHSAIDLFEELTGFKASAPEPVIVSQAIERMLTVTA